MTRTKVPLRLPVSRRTLERVMRLILLALVHERPVHAAVREEGASRISGLVGNQRPPESQRVRDEHAHLRLREKSRRALRQPPRTVRLGCELVVSERLQRKMPHAAVVRDGQESPTDLARAQTALQAAVELVRHHDARASEAELEELLRRPPRAQACASSKSASQRSRSTCSESRDRLCAARTSTFAQSSASFTSSSATSASRVAISASTR